jgi:hypothetical protein
MVMDQPVIIAVTRIFSRRRHSLAAGFSQYGDGGMCVSHHIALARGKAAKTIGRETGDVELTHGKLLHRSDAAASFEALV